METGKRHIVIVGGGFSGSTLAIQLLRGSPQWNVTVIDQGPVPGRGLAYSTPYDCHLLNVCATDMTALPDEPDHFFKWVKAHHDPAVQPRTFLPRAVYGKYIGAQLERAREECAGRLAWLQDEAISLRREGEQWLVGRKQGSVVPADTVVLALGNFPPGNPRLPGLTEQSRRYIAQPWSKNALADLPARGSVLLIGSGLTGVDLAIALYTEKFQGTIHFLSRHGLMPQRHELTDPWPRFWDASSPRTARGMLRLVRSQVRTAAQQGINWRSVIDAMRPVIRQVWQSLPLEERKRALRHVRSYWEVHRHRVAPEIGDRLQAMVQSGMAQLHAGRITRYTETADFVEVSYTARQSGAEHALRVDRVINCTGPATDYRKINHPLLADLFAQGLICTDELALGLQVDFDGALLDRAGKPSGALYAVGPARKGMLWESTAVPEIRVQASMLVQHLLGATPTAPPSADLQQQC
ncbi:MAG: FAD/NAD(P)-binding protein [Acidobacteria bacterium]|nr:FAD/NAD(P)-binding protein [Acidobacteriota bacterium]